ncbi:MAG: serine hydrolase domain-containing protein [Mycobacterium sp.]
MPGVRELMRCLPAVVFVVVLAGPSSTGAPWRATVAGGQHATHIEAPPAAPEVHIFSKQPDAVPAPGAVKFPDVSRLVNDAIAARRTPGAVVTIGHGGNVVLRQAYGSRTLEADPGPDGSPAPAEPMTEDTIFDIASLTKCLATATAVMQLHDQGKVEFDHPVQEYLPDFNTANDPQRATVTVRMLLTNTSGEGIDVNLGDPWGLDGPDKAEGVRRALMTPLQSAPGAGFRYSDINFMLLGALLEHITGEAEDTYVQRNVFAPLGMTDTGYLPPTKVCGPHEIAGTAIAWAPAPQGRVRQSCPAGTWDAAELSRIAPTALDEQNAADPSKNPDFGRLLRGTVHDPTARRMGGVAGNAGVFSTAHDVGVYAQALLDRLADRPSAFPVQRETLELMTSPEQPGRTPGQLDEANAAARASAAPNYPAVPGHDLFGFGWDIDTPYSRPRGTIFPIGSFGNTGFTGTSLWIDPGSDTYVILLTNCILIRGSTPITDLRADVATAAAHALGVDRGG